MWEAIVAIVGVIAALIPIIWHVVQRYWSAEAEEKKAREQDQKDASEATGKEQKKAIEDKKRHDTQDEIERRWREGEGLPGSPGPNE